MTQQPTTAPSPDTDAMHDTPARAVDNTPHPIDAPGGTPPQTATTEPVHAVAQSTLDELADYRNRITWETTCQTCARTLDGAYAETTRAETAETRIQAITEALVLWRDRPGGDVGLALALARVLDADKPEPPAATAVVRALRECDRIEREQHGRRGDDADGTSETVRRIRAALQGATEATAPLDIRSAQQIAWDNKVAHGFNTTDVPMEFGLLTAEVGEAFTAWRKGLPDAGEELADVFLYLTALAQMTGIDLAGEVASKMEKNARRRYERNQHGAFIRVETNSDPSTPHPGSRP